MGIFLPGKLLLVQIKSNLKKTLLTVDCSPPTIRVVPSWPHLQVGAVVGGAGVGVSVQHGLVGKVGVKSMPNLVDCPSQLTLIVMILHLYLCFMTNPQLQI